MFLRNPRSTLSTTRHVLSASFAAPDGGASPSCRALPDARAAPTPRSTKPAGLNISAWSLLHEGGAAWVDWVDEWVARVDSKDAIVMGERTLRAHRAS